MKILKGIPASIGLARGPAFLYREMEPEVVTTQIADPAVELAMLDRALAEAKAQIEAIRLKAEQEAGAEQAAIFEAHALFLSDPTLSKAVRSAVEKRRINATAAWRDAVEGYALQMESLGDETFRARAADIRDGGRRRPAGSTPRSDHLSHEPHARRFQAPLRRLMIVSAATPCPYSLP